MVWGEVGCRQAAGRVHAIAPRAFVPDVYKRQPPYIVFSDKTLRDMARIKPVTNAQFLAVNGVGQHKLDLYGQRFMQTIASFNAGSAS